MDIKQYVYESRTILKYIDFDTIHKIVGVLLEAIDCGSRIYVMGNGGSATTASHLAGDLNKTIGLKAMALTDSNYLITAVANDYSYDTVFKRQLETLAQGRDVVIAISGSGQSLNVMYGLSYAKTIGCVTIGLTGHAVNSGGGQVLELADLSIVIPSLIYEQIEDIHLMIGHLIVMELKNRKST